jgi:hypothetical protein
MDNAQKHNTCTNVLSSKTFTFYLKIFFKKKTKKGEQILKLWLHGHMKVFQFIPVELVFC